MSIKRLLLVSTWFQIIWLLAVVGNDNWQWLTLSLVTLTIVISYLYAGLRLLKPAFLVLLGITLDYLNLSVGLFEFGATSFPLWLVGLWGIFAWYAFYLHSVLTRYPLYLVSLVGGVGGALSYVAGANLGAVTFGLPLPYMLAILFLQWFAVVYVIMKVLGHENRDTNSDVFGVDE
ncbi:DUF2878 domain-containing protein [Vibrio pacinii]|uniref:DUF2878 domain-containing protein n=1 Tax=Vibrio pacinii TaxID=170674 RepID=UPI00056DA115|nr:DUF2878 domain-containing protein [Vibrio pacinii]